MRFPLKMADPVNAGRDKLAALNAPLAVTLLAELIVTVVRAAAPTVLLKKMDPVPAVNVRGKVPVSVLAKVMSPAPAPVSRATAAPKVVAELKLMLSLLVVMSPEVVIPVPERVTMPPEVMSPGPAMVKVVVGAKVTPLAVIVLLIFAAPVIVALKDPPV